MATLQLNGSKLELYTEFIDKDKCKSVPAGKWNGKLKCWEYPLGSVLDIVEVFKGDLKVTKEIDRLIKDTKAKAEQVSKALRGHGLIEHPFLMTHQKKCRRIAELCDRFAFFCDTGTGKTIISLQVIQDKVELNGAKFLVVAPKATIKDAWLSDSARWYPNIRLLPISRNMSKQDYLDIHSKWYGESQSVERMAKDKLKEFLADRAEVLVINPESFKIDIKFIESFGINGLVFDESALLRNGQSAITKAVTDFSKKVKYCYILSGEPDPNGRLEYFTQMRIIDPSLLGDSFTAFRSKYFTPVGYMGYEWEPIEGAKNEVTKRISRKSIVVKKKECLDLPPEVYQIRSVELSPEARRHYVTMQKEQVVFLQEADTVTAATKASVINKLRQITSGFVYDTHNDKEVVPLHGDKLKALQDTLDDIGNKQVIIWGTYQPEIEAIEAMLMDKGKSVVTAYGKTKNVDQSILDFKEGRAQYMIAHPQSIKYGVTLVNCSYAVYFSLSHNYDDYKQSKDRILRKGQTESCTIIFLLADKTIDRVIYDAVHNKGKEADIITKLIEQYSKEEIDD